ncbi:MAG: 1-deoxy-D-xylulose-5-phosphate reductoisomerase [Candidatus Omnitrophica bacterium]|nr:1-deoxy-D-xylulose-5-phosphate reductoisomerase [Candidatus Omnitrophota bacterium]
MKRIAVLGSTGSIGQSTLEVIKQFTGDFKVLALSTNYNTELLLRQAKEFEPETVCVADKPQSLGLKKSLGGGIKVLAGEEGLLEICRDTRIDEVVLAISGAGALSPLLCAIENKKEIALANKEALVMAGPLIMGKSARSGARIIPIDSEQSAIWQCLSGQDVTKLRHIYLTASGGPFRQLGLRKLKAVTVEQALAHPRWKMGKKITVDSATLMNKGLELLEAMHLFNLSPEKIKILVHPESIIHSMVEFIDGVILAQLSITDMRIPIQYALSYPDRLDNDFPRLDFLRLKSLNFQEPDFKKFPCLQLAYEAALAAGTMPAAMNAANEICVDEFLKSEIAFMDIPRVIEKVMSNHRKIEKPGLKEILDTDNWARQEAKRIIA